MSSAIKLTELRLSVFVEDPSGTLTDADIEHAVNEATEVLETIKDFAITIKLPRDLSLVSKMGA